MATARRRKGNKNQLESIKHWELKGYKVGKVENNVRFSKVRDLFGYWDLAAINKKELVLIQVSTNNPHTHRNYLEFSKEHPIPNIRYIQMTHYDRKGWKIFEYKDGEKKVEDLRK